MDPLSQALIGSSLAASFSKKGNIKIAALCGAIAGMAADLDIFIKSKSDPLLALEYHRHFTHSLFFVPFGGLLVAIFLWLILRKKKSDFRSLFLFSTLGYLTHGLLDSCTSYGTLLFWPFSSERVTWNLISIIDPIFTFGLIIIIFIGLFKKSPKIMIYSFIFALSYLSIGYFNKFRVQKFIKNIAQQRNHKIDRSFFSPSLANNILWRSIYQSGNHYFVDAVYVFPFKKVKFKEGKKVDIIDEDKISTEFPKNSIEYKDIKRFSFFAKNFIYLYPENKNIIADLRYGLLPHQDKALWGINTELKPAQKHVNFIMLRNIQKEDYKYFLEMLKGNDEFYKK